MTFDADSPLLDTLAEACLPLLREASDRILDSVASRIQTARPGLERDTARQLAERHASEHISPTMRVVIETREPSARVSYEENRRWHLMYEVRGGAFPSALDSAATAVIDAGVHQLSPRAQTHLAHALRAGGEILVVAEQGYATVWLNVPGRALIPLNGLASEQMATMLEAPSTQH